MKKKNQITYYNYAEQSGHIKCKNNLFKCNKAHFSGLYNVTRATCHISLEQNTVFPQCFLAFKTTATPVKGKRETKHF